MLINGILFGVMQPNTHLHPHIIPVRSVSGGVEGDDCSRFVFDEHDDGVGFSYLHHLGVMRVGHHVDAFGSFRLEEPHHDVDIVDQHVSQNAAPRII